MPSQSRSKQKRPKRRDVSTPALKEEVLELFRRWGSEGGKKRARTLTVEAQREIARNASLARWGRAKKGKT